MEYFSESDSKKKGEKPSKREFDQYDSDGEVERVPLKL